MNYFIDIGAFDGDTLGLYKSLFPDRKNWVVHAFEPNPKLLLELRKKETKKIKVYDKAAWTENTTIDFAVDSSSSPLGSTLMSGKKIIWDKNNKIEVEAFDFSAYLKAFKNDFVVVKMDCEGAEFPILEKMILDGTITIPKILMVEFHPNKVIEYTTTYKDDLFNRIKDLGVDIREWH